MKISKKNTQRVIFLAVLIATGLMPGKPAQASFPYGNYEQTQSSSSVGGSKSTYMEMTSPDLRNIRVTAFKIEFTTSYNTDPRYIRMGLYEGAIPGAPLVYDSGPVLIPNPVGYDSLTFPVSPPYDLGQNVPFGLALKTDANYTGSGISTCQGWSYCTSDAMGGDSDFFWNNQDEPNDVLFHFDPHEPFNPTLVGTNLLTTNKVGPYNTHSTYYYSMVYVLYPAIDSITPGFFNDGQTDILINGAGFEAKDEFGAGTSKVWLTENNDWAAPGIKVQQTDDTWNNNAITLTASFGALTPGATTYLWIENSDGQVNDTSIPVQLNIPCPSPPAEVINALSITPDDGTYIPDTFTITDEFTVDESVYGCLYTIDDGALWQPGVVIGSGPYTCTATNITAPGGTLLSVRMKATSCGGVSTADSLLTRTVDTTGPVSASFTTTPDDTLCTIDWSSTDSGVGMHPTEPYELRYSIWYMSSCTAGTHLYLGTDTSRTHTGRDNGETYHYKLCQKDAYGNITASETTCTLDATPWTVLGDGASPPNWYTKASAVNQTVSTFTLALTNGLPTDTDLVTELVVTGSNTANVSSVKIHRDEGGVADKYDNGDTLIAAASFAGDTATFSGINIPVTDTTTQYIITYDTVASPTQGEKLSAYVSSATAQAYSVDNNDSVDANLTLDTTPPTTTDNVYSSGWSSSERSVALGVNDTGGSGVDTSSGLFGCFGTNCTPVPLGGIIMSTNCGAGNACQYDFSYYSMDLAGNAEAVKTDAHYIGVDRELPLAGTFNAYGGATPITLTMVGFTDLGSGMGYFRIRRANGSTAPADCASGTQRYLGSDTSFNDSSVTNGQQYSYRLCAYDDVGNYISDFVATATAGEQCSSGNIMCDSCHGPDSNTRGGSRLAGPRGHALHGPECGMCHREGGDPAHVDGIVTINSQSGYQGGESDISWPDGAGGMSCGGPGNWVGGDPGGGGMGCHMGGTPSFPGITPEWECMWEEFPMCSQPFGP